MSQQNKALARRIFDEMESKGNLAIADETFASDFVKHSPLGEDH